MTESDRPLTTVMLATYKESETIVSLVTDILQTVPAPLEVIVVDDDSPDGTAEVIRGMQDERVRVIHRQGTRGLASAYMRGLIESRGEVICWMDADGCHPVSLVPEMIRMLDTEDVVIGSRFVEGGKDDRDRVRVLTSIWINTLARWVLGYGIGDYDSGFIVLRRSVLDHALFVPTGYGEYFIELVYNACRKGMRVKEIGYVFRDRDVGESKSFQSWFRFLRLGSRYVLRIVRARLFPLD